MLFEYSQNIADSVKNVAHYPNAGAHSHEFLEEFTDLLETYCATRDNVLIADDFNIHMDDENNDFTRDFATVCDEFSLHQHVNAPTHISGHTIDLILTRNNHGIDVSQTASTLFSDHYAIECNVSIPKKDFPTKQVQSRHIKDIDMTSFRDDVRHACDNLDTDNTISVNAMLSNFLTTV